MTKLEAVSVISLQANQKLIVDFYPNDDLFLAKWISPEVGYFLKRINRADKSRLIQESASSVYEELVLRFRSEDEREGLLHLFAQTADSIHPYAELTDLVIDVDSFAMAEPILRSSGENDQIRYLGDYSAQVTTGLFLSLMIGPGILYLLGKEELLCPALGCGIAAPFVVWNLARRYGFVNSYMNLMKEKHWGVLGSYSPLVVSVMTSSLPSCVLALVSLIN